MTAALRPTTLRLLLPAVFLLGALAVGAGSAEAAIPWAACPTAGYECAHVDVPLDRSGAVPGTVSLAVSRVPAASNPGHTATLALAGGPGQAALALTQDFARVLAPAIANRDLLVYDQRGTGLSGALDCSALHTIVGAIDGARSCASQIGAARGFYRTSDTVEDIEALRVAGGYDKLVLFGVSYGTKVALAYAAAHPANVEKLVLDSVVLPEGPDPFQRSTLSSVPRVLADLCAGGACAAATPDVDGDLARVAAKLRASPLRGTVITAGGKRSTYQMRQTGLLDILLAGDVNPTLRAELPGSIRAALRGDPAPLLRLSVRSEGLTTGHQLPGGDSDALFLATTCEEAPFQWTRTADAAQRAQEIVAVANQIPRTQLGPFSPRAAIQGGTIPFCLGWPNAAPAPAPPGPLPTVPTLVLDGQMDLRTPFEDASQIPSRIPGATVVEVPYTGHSVVASDQSSCAANSLAAFFADSAPPACPATKNPFAPTPRPPVALASVRAVGPGGRIGRTVSAVRATVTDAWRQIVGEALAQGRAPSRVGGLRGGNATVSSTTFRMRQYEYVKGVQVSGKVTPGGKADVTVRGGGAATGTLHITAGGAVSGRLDGRRVTIGASSSVRDGLPTLKRVLAHPHLGR
jgi:pimeloyl-ACP methyl ester carboxylesterase